MLESDAVNQRIDDKTSFGSYMSKQVRTWAIGLVGAAIGVGAGFAAGRSEAVRNTAANIANRALRFVSKSHNAEMLAENAEKLAEEAIAVIKPDHMKAGLMVAGGLVGSTAAGISQTYEHWVNVKGQQLRVEEMTNEILTLREQRNSMVDELRDQRNLIKKQTNRIEDILERGPKSLAMDAPPENMTRHAERQDDNERGIK